MPVFNVRLTYASNVEGSNSADAIKNARAELVDLLEEDIISTVSFDMTGDAEKFSNE